MGTNYKEFRDLKVYQLSYTLANEIFELSKSFPKEERYSLTDQIRRSSRSVPANISEAWSHRSYFKAFVSKLIISHGEASETEVWLDFARDHDYISRKSHQYLFNRYEEVEKIPGSMIRCPEKFCYCNK